MEVFGEATCMSALLNDE